MAGTRFFINDDENQAKYPRLNEFNLDEHVARTAEQNFAMNNPAKYAERREAKAEANFGRMMKLQELKNQPSMMSAQTERQVADYGMGEEAQQRKLSQIKQQTEPTRMMAEWETSPDKFTQEQFLANMKIKPELERDKFLRRVVGQKLGLNFGDDETGGVSGLMQPPKGGYMGQVPEGMIGGAAGANAPINLSAAPPPEPERLLPEEHLGRFLKKDFQYGMRNLMDSISAFTTGRPTMETQKNMLINDLQQRRRNQRLMEAPAELY